MKQDLGQNHQTGKGGEEKKLQETISRLKCGDYVRLMGQHNLDKVYINYESYLSGSTSEGFGLTLMEAVGSGLPIIGFDVPYGNQNFVENGKNGFVVPVHDKMSATEKIEKLADCIIRMFTVENLEEFHKYSYKKAKGYLTVEVEKRWEALLKEKE